MYCMVRAAAQPRRGGDGWLTRTSQRSWGGTILQCRFIHHVKSPGTETENQESLSKCYTLDSYFGVFGSNLGRETGYTEWGFPWFTSVPSVKYWDCISIIKRPLLFESFPFRPSKTVPFSNDIWSWYSKRRLTVYGIWTNVFVLRIPLLTTWVMARPDINIVPVNILWHDAWRPE
jgi:hypothetical protein